jgi:hypothetical protein
MLNKGAIFVAPLLACFIAPGLSVQAAPNSIFVDYEYGDLKEVIVGVPFNSNSDLAMANFGQEYVRLAGVSQQYTRDPIPVHRQQRDREYDEVFISPLRHPGFSPLVPGARDGLRCHWTARLGVDYSRMIKDGLEACGITVYPLYFGRHNEDGGSIRCSPHPLVRRLGE